MNEDLRTWFKQKWVRMDTKGEIKGDCAREPGEGKPKCLPMAKARSMSKVKRAAAARRKRREDPVADRSGKGNKPIFVSTNEEFLEEGNKPTNPALWSKAKSLARSKFDVYPSAYANGWAAKWYKSKGGGWKSVSEEVEGIEEACWRGYKAVGKKMKNGRLVPNCVPVSVEEARSDDPDYDKSQARFKKGLPPSKKKPPYKEDSYWAKRKKQGTMEEAATNPEMHEEVEQIDEGNKDNKVKKNKYVADIIKKKLSPEVLSSLKFGRRELKKEEVEQMDEKHLTPAERKKREEIAQAMERKSPGMDMGKKMAIATAQAKKVAEGYGSGGQFGPKRYGSREDDFGHEAPDMDHVHSEPKDHGLTVHNHEGKEIGTVPKRHFEPMTAAMNIAMKHSRATGENTEVRRFGKKVESFKGKKVNESKNIIREVIRKAVDKQGTNKANEKTATGAPAAKIKIDPSIDIGPNKRGMGGT